MGGGALGLVVLGYMGENAKAAICLYVFVVAIGCCTNVGFNINHLDLAPNYAGILMGLTNAVASVGGVLAPTVCGFIVRHQVRKACFVRNYVVFLFWYYLLIFYSSPSLSSPRTHRRLRWTNGESCSRWEPSYCSSPVFFTLFSDPPRYNRGTIPNTKPVNRRGYNIIIFF